MIFVACPSAYSTVKLPLVAVIVFASSAEPVIDLVVFVASIVTAPEVIFDVAVLSVPVDAMTRFSPAAQYETLLIV